MPAQLAHLLAFVSRIMPPLVASLQVALCSARPTSQYLAVIWLALSCDFQFDQVLFVPEVWTAAWS